MKFMMAIINLNVTSIMVLEITHLVWIVFSLFGSPDDGYCFKSNSLFLKSEKIKYEQQVWDHMFKNFCYMVPTKRQLAKFFVETI